MFFVYLIIVYEWMNVICCLILYCVGNVCFYVKIWILVYLVMFLVVVIILMIFIILFCRVLREICIDEGIYLEINYDYMYFFLFF